MRSFRERTAVVTGAAGGIGLALARELAVEGCHVALVDRNAQRLAEVRETLAPFGVRVTTHGMDVSDPAAHLHLRDEVLQQHGAVHLLVNNAGITHYGAFEQFTLEQIQQIIGVNLLGVLYGCHAFLPLLREQSEGHLVNMSSMAAISGIPRQSTYCTSKAGVRALSESLAAELRGSPIGVTWMLAGPVGTDIMTSATSHDPAATERMGSLLKRYAMTPEQAARRILKTVKGGGGEIRLTLMCEGYHAFNRLAPGTLRSAMGTLNRVASRFDRG